ncbi:hypothetical protein DFH09DRAFT_1313936 [Mycena vulgaris]|nr:hypothetical protein DFH09DRAFT_1313936 [Mycena vulgaris]
MSTRHTRRILPRLETFRNPLTARRQTQAHRAPSPFLLPLELWELILNELPDQSLLIAARVCRAFNDRCIVLYFARHEIPVQSLTGDFLKIDAHLLRALQVQRLRPRLSTLICRFWPFYVLRDMKLLLELIKKSPGLAELRLSFSEDLLTAHTLDTIFPYSQHTLVDAFCDVIRAMAAKTEAPVVLIVFGRIYYLRPRDLARWGLRYFSPGKHLFGQVAWIDRAHFRRKGTGTQPYMFLPIPSSGSHLKFERMLSVHSVNVHAIAAAPKGIGPLTLISFAVATQTPSSLFCNGPVPGSQLTRILPLLTLPSLRTLALNADVDPAVLGQFLIRHPTITVIQYAPRGRLAGGAPPEPVGYRIFTEQPMALPALTTLSSSDAAKIIPLLNTFWLSPRLSTIDIGFERDTPTCIASLKRGLRRLSLHPRPVCLRICKWRADALAIDAEERQIVGCLYAVDSMHVDARGAAELLALLPWVEMLPALRRLEVMIYVDEQARRVSLLPEVRAALPWVPDVMILPW